MPIFTLLDLFCGALSSGTFCRRVFLVFQMGESLKQDSRPLHETSLAGLWELEASALSTTYTLAAISLASGQFSSESASELAWRREARELHARPENNESKNASVSLDEISITSAWGFVTIKCGEEACVGSNSCEACAWLPKLTKSSKYEYNYKTRQTHAKITPPLVLHQRHENFRHDLHRH
jgi:hypothetical protein